MNLQEIVVVIGTLIFLEGILSIDNAAVLGAMTQVLPEHEEVPWPRFLRRFKDKLNKTFGPQRAAALKVGLVGAYLGRALMLLIATWVVHNPWLKLLGGAYLFKLGLEGLAIKPKEDRFIPEENEPGFKKFWTVVLAIELADLAFSLDNVVAAVAISSNLTIILIGVGIGIVTMRFAAGGFGKLIGKMPWLTRTAYLLIVLIAIEVFWQELTGHEISHAQRFGVSAGAIAVSYLYNTYFNYTFLRKVFTQLGNGFYYLNKAVDTLLSPLLFVIRTIVLGFYQQAKNVFTALAIASRAIESRLRRDRR